MVEEETRGSSGERSRKLKYFEVGLLLFAAGSAAFYAHSANRIANESLKINERLAASALAQARGSDSREAARDFLVRYQGVSCVQKVAMMQFPLRRFFSLDGSAGGVVLDQSYVSSLCVDAPGRGSATWVVRDIHVASASGPNEFSVTADVAYDLGEVNGSHDMDGTAMVQMTLVGQSQQVESFEDLRLVSIAEVVCSRDDDCS